MQVEAQTALIAASHRALTGTDPRDAWRIWDLELEDAGAFMKAWVDEIGEKSAALGVDTEDIEHIYLVAIGALAVGIEYGRGLEGRNAAKSPN